MTGKLCRNSLTDVPNAQRKKHVRKWRALRSLNTLQHILRRQLLEAFQLHNVIAGEVVEIGRTLHQTKTIQLLYRLFTQRINVHRPPLDKMLDAPCNLRRASRGVRTVVGSFTFPPNKGRSTFGTVGDVGYGPSVRRTPCEVNTRYLRYDLAAFLDEDIVSFAQVKTRDLIRIVK